MRRSVPLLAALAALALGAQGGGESPGREEIEITILHTGGVLSDFEKIPALARMVEEERGRGGPVLLVDTGDHMDPARLETTVTGGKINIDLMNRLGYDAMAIGIGELQYGLDEDGREEIANRIGDSLFPLLSANLVSIGADGRERQIAPPCWPVVAGGIRVGFVGVTSSGKEDSHARRRIGERFRFDQEIDAVDRWVRTLRTKVDLVVVLSNGGIPVASAILGRGVEADVVVCVSAMPCEEPLVISKGRIVWVPEEGVYLGKIRLRVARDPSSIVGFEYESAPVEGEGDPAVAAEIREMSSAVTGEWDAGIGEVAEDFSVSESADLVVDVLRMAGRAQIAICDTSEITRPLKQGRITGRDLWALLPRRRRLVEFRIEGGDLRAFLERDLAKGGRYRLSGLEYVYDPTAEEGEQILSVTVGKQPLRVDRKYLCVADEGTAGGEDFLPGATGMRDTGRSVREALAGHIRSVKGPLQPVRDGRARREVPGAGTSPEGEGVR